MTVSRLLARPLLSTIYVVGPVKALQHPDKVAALASRVTDRMAPLTHRIRVSTGLPMPEKPETWVRVNAAVQLTAALALATGRQPRLSAAVLAATTIPTTIAGHPFWQEEDPAVRTQQQIQLAKNLSILGGLALAAVDTDAKPGLVWRARRAARDARREARHLTKAARQEARIAKASLT